MNTQIKYITIYALVVCMYSCSAPSDLFSSERLSGNDFRNYKTYAFTRTNDTAYTKMINKQQFEQNLATEVIKQLNKRNMKLDTTKPDCIFTYTLVMNRKYAVNNNQEVVYNPDVFIPAFDNEARIYTFSSNNRPAVYGGKINVDTLRQGSLVIDMIDIKENKIVWHATAKGERKESYSQPQPEMLEYIVQKMFRKFPKK
ncbi:MAG TPA: DUF4136 domain-containing protein [Chitinophagaceae bacterium]